MADIVGTGGVISSDMIAAAGVVFEETAFGGVRSVLPSSDRAAAAFSSSGALEGRAGDGHEAEAVAGEGADETREDDDEAQTQASKEEMESKSLSCSLT